MKTSTAIEVQNLKAKDIMAADIILEAMNTKWQSMISGSKAKEEIKEKLRAIGTKQK